MQVPDIVHYFEGERFIAYVERRKSWLPWVGSYYIWSVSIYEPMQLRPKRTFKGKTKTEAAAYSNCMKYTHGGKVDGRDDDPLYGGDPTYGN